ncbi:FliM/FliN family flagellar motor switch protein [Erythrobacter sp. MTPC3]|uniref:FliM/FliN family flagellar motor switch protein n=1 Tax=Erythrobacter sp. MTPC3 TaxID=3056564 RepID=UPI0036F359E9
MTTQPNTFQILGNVTVCVSVELGRTQMLLRDVLALGEDSVVPLDRLTDELLDVMVNGRQIAKAEVTTQGNKFALRIVELLSDADSAGAIAWPAQESAEASSPKASKAAPATAAEPGAKAT